MFSCNPVIRQAAVWIACVAALLLSSPVSAQSNEPAKPRVKIRFVSTLSSSTFPVSYAIENGIFAKREVFPVQRDRPRMHGEHGGARIEVERDRVLAARPIEDRGRSSAVIAVANRLDRRPKVLVG